MKNILFAGTLATLMAAWTWTTQAQPARPGAGRGGFGPPQGGPGQFLMRMPLWRALDANGDGKISAEERAKAAEALKALDQDQNGDITPDEVRPQPLAGGPGGPPPGAGPQRPGGEGRRGPGAAPGGRSFGPRGAGEAAVFEAKTLAADADEERILAVLDDMDRNQRRGSMSVPVEDGRLLRLLVEAIGARKVVEVGTSIGYSGTWMCLGLRKTGGHLTTLEIDADRAARARSNFKRAGVDQLVTLIEGNAHETIQKIEGPVDLVFIDADKEGYIDYLEKILPKVRPGGLIVAHNMNPRQADPRFVKAITTNPQLETLFLHMQGAGVAVSMKKR